MITLRRLFFEPNKLADKIIDPILFESGINFIIGEKTVEDNSINKKMNGVGKSILVEAINFCLFKDLETSRINKIPDIVLNDNTYVCLDIDLETNSKIIRLTIKRARSKNKAIFIINDGIEKEFEEFDEAKKYLEFLILPSGVEKKPSLRSLFSILIREERTSFDDILYPYGKSSRFNFSELIKPHLYLFNIDLAIVERMKKIIKDIDDAANILRSVNKDFKSVGVGVKEVRSYINELEDMVKRLDLSVNNLEPSEGVAQFKQKILELENELEGVLSSKAAKQYMVKRIKELPSVERIDVEEIKIVYNQFKSGLGDTVKQSLQQVVDFKEQIAEFQTSLMTEKLSELNSEVDQLENKRKILDSELSIMYAKTGAGAKIEMLKRSLVEYENKNSELARLKGKYATYNEKMGLKKSLSEEKNLILKELEEKLSASTFEINQFEEDLKQIHASIAENKNCHFQIKINQSSKEYIDFDYRIKLDGSSGINRIKTFIYDVLLMLNDFTGKKHPKFLIHDNIFASVGRDDMVKALNVLNAEVKNGKEFQYILTINKDEIDSVVQEFHFDHNKFVRATFTRSEPFLKQVYRED